MNHLLSIVSRLQCKAEFPALTVTVTVLPQLANLYRRNGLLLLNPVTNRQFLTLLYDIQRLVYIPNVESE